MLSIKENLHETLKKDGHPDRFVNQYEFMGLVPTPNMQDNHRPEYMGEPVRSNWGVLFSWPEGTPAAFPIHTPETIVIKDMEHWQDYVKIPRCSGFEDEMWGIANGIAAGISAEGKIACPMLIPGMFEQCHNLMEITNFLTAFYEYPDELHDLIKAITDWELGMADQICSHMHPEGIFHHDDWGSQQSTFISPAMFDDFFLDGYKQIYQYYKDHGVKVIVHHADSYAATLVPAMIEMGIDIWQGAMTSNNIPELIKQYGDRITIMSGIDAAWVDNPSWSREQIREVVKRELDKYDPHNFIPCISIGGPFTIYEEVYGVLSEEIDRYNKERFNL